MSIDQDAEVRATLLVVHESDIDACAILDEAAAQVARGNATGHMRVVIDQSTPADAALWTAQIVGADGAMTTAPLFTHLAGLGRLSMFRFVAVCTLSGDAGVADELNARMRDLREKTAHLLGDDRPRTQARIGIVGYGDDMVDRRFFSAIADANLAVIPLDRLQDSSIAQPIQRSQVEIFRTHGAVELLSATGLWRTMEEAPIDHVRSTAGGGGGEVRVRFAQSRMRLLRTPALPVASLLSEDRELPLPDGYQPAVNGAARIARADGMLPPELIYRPSERPGVARQQVATKDLLLLILKEVLGAVLQLPSLIWRAAGGEVGSLTRHALQEAVGSDSVYRVLTANDEPDAQSPEELARRQRSDIDRRIRDVVNDDTIETRLDPIPGEIWTTLVGETLGLIDGDAGCSALRTGLFGDEQYVPVDREVILGGLAGIPQGVALLAGASVDDGMTSEAGPRSAEDEGSGRSGAPDASSGVLPPPVGEPLFGPISATTPLGAWIRDESDRFARIRASWPLMAKDPEGLVRPLTAGALKGDVDASRKTEAVKAVEAILKAGSPYDLSGGVLTVRLGRGALNPKVADVTSEGDWSQLLVALISKVAGSAPASVRFLMEGEEGTWERMISRDELARMLDLEKGRTVNELGKFGVKLTSSDALITSEDVRSILAADRSRGPGLHDAMTAAGPGLAKLVFGRPASTIDSLRELMHDTERSDSPLLDVEGRLAEIVAEAEDSTIGEHREGDGLLVRLWSAISQQRVNASRDILRLIGILREEGEAVMGPAVQRSVPVGAGVGVVILLLRIGISEPSLALIQSREWTAYQLDLWFTISTLLILAFALFLTNIGKQLGGQTRVMVFGAASFALLAYVIIYFDGIRTLVSGPLRDNRTFALILGFFTVSFVAYAAIQSWLSGSKLRIQGSRVLGFMVLIYALGGLVLLQAQPDAWVATRSEDFARRFDTMLLWVAIALILLALAIITIARLRASRRIDNSAETRDWALRALEDAVEMRELLILAERQWLVTLAALAHVVRRPFGAVAELLDAKDAVSESQVLKSASVRLALSERGTADLESRVRQELVRPSWLRVQYEGLVRDYQEMIASRSGVPASSLDGRRPESDPTVPTADELTGGAGRGDRFEFASLVASGRLDHVRQRPISGLDVAKVFQPMLAERSIQSLEGFGGRASTVRDFFEQVLPETESKIPDGVIRTALAANDQARRMRSFVWWPEAMLGEAEIPVDGEIASFPTDLFRRGVVGGAGLVSVRVDISGEFTYGELVGAVDATIHGDHGSETVAQYEGSAGL